MNMVIMDIFKNGYFKKFFTFLKIYFKNRILVYCYRKGITILYQRECNCFIEKKSLPFLQST
jgi:hypothetical protein